MKGLRLAVDGVNIKIDKEKVKLSEVADLVKSNYPGHICMGIVNNKLYDLNRTLYKDASIRLIDTTQPDGKRLYFRGLSLMGAELVVLPAAFNMTTGPAHWETSVKMRAVDNQIYMLAAAPARDENSSYISYANSRVVSPWGNIISSANEEECIIYANIEACELERVRNELPLLKHLRKDIYRLDF